MSVKEEVALRQAIKQQALLMHRARMQDKIPCMRRTIAMKTEEKGKWTLRVKAKNLRTRRRIRVDGGQGVDHTLTLKIKLTRIFYFCSCFMTQRFSHFFFSTIRLLFPSQLWMHFGGMCWLRYSTPRAELRASTVFGWCAFFLHFLPRLFSYCAFISAKCIAPNVRVYIAHVRRFQDKTGINNISVP
jgi:hypothetical protein